MRDEIQKLVSELFSLTGITSQFEVIEKEEKMFEINIASDSETGLLIGFRGENINSLQTIISLMLKNKLGEWVRIIVNVGDYRQKQEEKLEDLANQAAQRALETGEAQPIYNLSSGQRRTIHMYLSERNDVVTESQGEEPERFLVVKPNK